MSDEPIIYGRAVSGANRGADAGANANAKSEDILS